MASAEATQGWQVHSLVDGYGNAMRLPDFLIIGTARGGTTSLYHALRGSDGIFMPQRTELHFFSLRLFNNPAAPLSEYARHFEKARDDEVVGEKSPSYFWFASAAANIHQRLPNVRLIATLREPAERAISDFKMGKKHPPAERDLLRLIDQGIASLMAGRPFETVVDPAAIIWKGMYGRHLRRFLRLFGARRLLLIDFESLRDSERVLKEITTFIEARPTPLALARINSSAEITPCYDVAMARLRDFYRSNDDYDTVRRSLRIV